MPDIFLYAGQSSPANVRLSDPTVVIPSGGSDISFNISGVSSTCSQGTVVVTGDANVAPPGVSSAGQIGTPTVTASASVSVAGVSAAGAVGTITITASASVSATGLSATGAVGTPMVTAGATVLTSGVTTSGQIGAVTVTDNGAVVIDGLSSSAQLGQVTALVTYAPDLPIRFFVYEKPKTVKHAIFGVAGVSAYAKVGVVSVEIVHADGEGDADDEETLMAFAAFDGPY